MSGHSGSNGGGGYESDTACDRLRFEAQLTSPVPEVVAQIAVGHVLDIAIGVQKGVVVLQVLKEGAVAGGLTGPDAARLRKCVEQGEHFRATVRNVNGGQVRVFVEHV